MCVFSYFFLCVFQFTIVSFLFIVFPLLLFFCQVMLFFRTYVILIDEKWHEGACGGRGRLGEYIQKYLFTVIHIRVYHFFFIMFIIFIINYNNNNLTFAIFLILPVKLFLLFCGQCLFLMSFILFFCDKYKNYDFYTWHTIIRHIHSVMLVILWKNCRMAEYV